MPGHWCGGEATTRAIRSLRPACRSSPGTADHSLSCLRAGRILPPREQPSPGFRLIAYSETRRGDSVDAFVLVTRLTGTGRWDCPGASFLSVNQVPTPTPPSTTTRARRNCLDDLLGFISMGRLPRVFIVAIIGGPARYSKLIPPKVGDSHKALRRQLHCKSSAALNRLLLSNLDNVAIP